MNTRLVNSAAGVILAALTQNRTAAGIALALESAGLLMGPDTAAELARLRQYAEHKQSREEELLATLGQYNLVASPDAWALGMTVISHLEGPHTPSTPEEPEPGLRKLIEQLRARVAELEAEPRVRPVDEDPIAFTVVGAIATEPHAFKAQYQGESDAKRRLPNCKVCGRPAIDPAHDEDVRPQVRKLRALLAGQRLEDPHNGPLSHSYRVGRDLPETGGTR